MPSLLERAKGILRQNEADAKAKQQTEQQRDFAKLLSILPKGDAATDADVDTLADIARRRRLDETALQAMTDAIAEAGRLTDLHGQLKAAQDKSRAAQEAKVKAGEEIVAAKARAAAANQAAEVAVRFSAQCGQAAKGLKNLARDFPQLFDTSGDVPVLLGK